MSKTDEHWMLSSIMICSIVIINDFLHKEMFLCTTFMILHSPTRLHLVRIDIFTTCFLHWILTCYSMQLKNAGACIWISSQRFTLKYIMNAYDGKLYLEPNLIHIFFKRFPSLICTWHFTFCPMRDVSIAGTLGCVFIDNDTHESGVTKCTTGEAWSAFSWHHSSVFHCQWTHNQVFLLLSHMLI